MSKMPGLFEVPAELRDMLGRSVAQVREGFEKIMAAAGQASSQLDVKKDALGAKALDMHRQTLAQTEANVAAAFDLAGKLVKAETLEEVIRLQNDYLASRVAALQGQFAAAPGAKGQAPAKPAAKAAAKPAATAKPAAQPKPKMPAKPALAPKPAAKGKPAAPAKSAGKSKTISAASPKPATQPAANPKPAAQPAESPKPVAPQKDKPKA